MRVGIDTRPLFFTTAGIARYTRDLATAVLKRHEDCVLLGPKDPASIQPPVDAPGDAWRVIRFPLRNRALETVWQEVLLPRAARRLGLDLIHHPRFDVPYRRAVPSVVTVHDIAFQLRDDILPPERRAEFVAATVRGTRRADAVITVSEQTRSDLLDWLDLDPARVHAVHNGVSAAYSVGDREQARDRVRDALDLAGPYFLFLGTIEPRKNLVNLIEAYGRLPAGSPTLVLGGARGWMSDPIYDAAQASPATARIRFLDFVPEAILADLYRAAEAFVLPSHYEGFGIPALEAMACGTPVVVSDVSSLPEVCGECAVYVQPDDPDSIADGLTRAVEDAETAARLRRDGSERAAAFTWDETARRTLDVYASVIAGDDR